MHCFTDNQSKGGSVRLACLCLMILLKMLSSLFQRTLCANAFGLPFGPMRMSPCLVLPPGMVLGSSEGVTHPRAVHVLMSCPWRSPDPSSRPPPPQGGSRAQPQDNASWGAESVPAVWGIAKAQLTASLV